MLDVQTLATLRAAIEKKQVREGEYQEKWTPGKAV